MLDFGKANAEEKERIFALCASCLNTSADYFSARDAGDPFLLRDERIVARDGGRVVSNVTLFEFPLSFGKSLVKTGGIADVATNPAYRGQGSASELLRQAHATMRARGLPLAILGTDIHPFYERIGYITWEMSGLRFLGLSVPETETQARLIDLKRDLHALMELNARAREGSVGVLVRSREFWLGQQNWFRIFPGMDPELSLISGDGKAFLRAMYNPDQGRASIMDFGAEAGASQAVSDISAALLAKLAARGAKALWLPGSCRGLVEEIARNAQIRELAPNCHLMLKVLSWPGLLRSLSSELATRLGAVGPGAVALHYQDQAVTIRCAERGLEIENSAAAGLPYARLEPAQWVEVLMGGRLFSSQPFARQSRLGEKEINLLDALFPKRDGLFWEADFF